MAHAWMLDTAADMSYTWRSILRGVCLLKKGLIWRVGHGNDLSIWTDPWLPRDMSRRPITPKGTSLLRNVADLLDPATGSWDSQLVRDTFWEEDANLILAIPVHEGMDNKAAWHFDKKGTFSVKSAYKVFRDNQIMISRRGGGLIIAHESHFRGCLEEDLEYSMCKQG